MIADVVVRADASIRIGTGHVMRSLTLADRLRTRGLIVAFACRRFEGNACNQISKRGYPLIELGDPIDESRYGWLGVPLSTEIKGFRRALERISRPPRWIVVDHYELDCDWEREVAGNASVFVIDDLADRQHDCAALLDQNLQDLNRYDGLIPTLANRFLGPSYALVRDSFLRARHSARERSGDISRILVSYGGIDASGETVKALRALRGISGSFVVDVVISDASPAHSATIAEASLDPRVTAYGFVDNFAELMAGADLALGAAGTTSWERCFLGLPAIVTAIAPNQKPILDALASHGAVLPVGGSAESTVDQIAVAVRSLLTNRTLAWRMALKASEICTGHESAAEEILDVFVDHID